MPELQWHRRDLRGVRLHGLRRRALRGVRGPQLNTLSGGERQRLKLAARIRCAIRVLDQQILG